MLGNPESIFLRKKILFSTTWRTFISQNFSRDICAISPCRNGVFTLQI